MKYKVVGGFGNLKEREEFCEEVQKNLNEGWKLAGGVSILVVGDKVAFAQAMTFEKTFTNIDYLDYGYNNNN